MTTIFRQVGQVVTDLQNQDGLTEDRLLQELDHRVRRISVHPPKDRSER